MHLSRAQSGLHTAERCAVRCCTRSGGVQQSVSRVERISAVRFVKYKLPTRTLRQGNVWACQCHQGLLWLQASHGRVHSNLSSGARLRDQRGRCHGAVCCMAAAEGQYPPGQGPVTTSGATTGLLAAFTVERLGEQAWLFATPFMLLSFQSNNGALVGPALYGMSRMCAQTVLGPPLGSWMDNSRRLHVILAAASVQILSITAAIAVCWLIGSQAATAIGAPETMVWGFAFICVLGVVDALGKMLSSVAISRDWVPALYGRNTTDLNNINTQLARLDLVAEIVGPIGAGLLFGLLQQQTFSALILLGMLRIICLLVHTAFFVDVLRHHPELSQRQGLDLEAPGSAPSGVLASWKIFLRHPGKIQMVVFSYALLYLTVLSPHGLVLTAYLSTQNLPPSVLSLFRGSGALVGVVGVTVFQAAVRAFGLHTAALRFICFQAACCVAAATVFVVPFQSDLAMYAFMLLIVLARFGLYGFEVGALQIQQMNVKEDSRGAFGTVEKSLCASASLVMYVASALTTASGTASHFWIVICGSAVAVLAAASVCVTWRRAVT